MDRKLDRRRFLAFSAASAGAPLVLSRSAISAAPGPAQGIPEPDPLPPSDVGQWSGPYYWLTPYCAPPPTPPANCSDPNPCPAMGSEFAHASLVPSGPQAGNILAWQQTADSTQDTFLVDPTNPSIYQPIPAGPCSALGNIYCSGHVRRIDGYLLAAGGEAGGATGVATSFLYTNLDATSCPPQAWLAGPLLASTRWYPTVVRLGDGRAWAAGGWTSPGNYVTSSEVYDPSVGPTGTWCSPGPANLYSFGLYPRLHLLPSGHVYYAGEGTGHAYFSIPSSCAQPVLGVGGLPYSAVYRDDGCSVLLPLQPTNPAPYGSYHPRILILGGTNGAVVGAAAHSTVELNDNPDGGGNWTMVTPGMSIPRVFANAVLLPDKSVLVIGGATTRYDTANPGQCCPPGAGAVRPVLTPELFRMNGFLTGTWSSMAAHLSPRLYHSTAVLTPQAEVLVIGGQQPHRMQYSGNPSACQWQAWTSSDAELFRPPYLFWGPRPYIAAVDATVASGGVLHLLGRVTNGSISSVVLVRPGSVTHHFDFEQRLVELAIVPGGTMTGSFDFYAQLPTGPNANNILPLGYYMVFVVTSGGVPSIARFVQVI